MADFSELLTWSGKVVECLNSAYKSQQKGDKLEAIKYSLKALRNARILSDNKHSESGKSGLIEGLIYELTEEYTKDINDKENEL